MQIKNIKKVGKRKVYDISVENIHNFFLSCGVLSHNSGKSTSLISFAQAYHDNPSRGYKIFDLWGGDRNEHLYWTLPSNEFNYWNNAKKILRLNKPGPKQYKVNLLYPLTRNLPKQLPFNPPNVFSNIFTVPFRDVKLEDFSLVIGNPSLKAESVWREVKEKSKKNTGPAELIKIIKDLKGQSTSLYANAIKPFINELFLQDENCQFNLNLKKEIDDKETITVLCLDFVEKELRLFILGYFLRKMAEVLDARGRRTKNIMIIREASEFFRATDQAIVHDRYKIFKSYLSHYIRMGRRGMHLLLDSQSPSETRGMVDGQQDLTLLGRLPSEADRRDATDQLFRDNLITKTKITAIATLEPGQFIVCPSGQDARFHYFLLPRTRFWKEGDGNFYKNTWKNAVNRWCNYDEEREKLLEDFKTKKKQIEDDEKAKKELEKLKKEKEKENKKQSKFIKKEQAAIDKLKKKVNVVQIKRNINKSKDINKNVNEDDSEYWGGFID